MTWRILCEASDIVCSVAPLSSHGRDWWGNSYDGKNCFASRRRANPPSHKRSIMYHHGRTDLTLTLILTLTLTLTLTSWED